MNTTLKKSKRKNLTALFFCACGIALNLLLGSLVTALGLPVYLDTAGTIVVSLMGGFLPGIIVGFVTNIIKSISDPGSLYYGVLNIMIAMAALHISKRKRPDSFGGAALMIVVFTLIGGGIGSLIPWFMEDLSFDNNALMGVLYRTGAFSVPAAHITANLILDLIDKTATVLLVLIIIRLIPDRFKNSFRLTLWKQNPLSDEEMTIVDKERNSLRIKTLILLTVSMSLVAIAAVLICMRVYHKNIIRDRVKLARGIVRIAASELNGNRIDEYLKKGEDALDYKTVREHIAGILKNSTDVEYLYVYRLEDDGFHVVIDIDTDDTPADPVGAVIKDDKELEEYLRKLSMGKNAEPIITDDEYGYLLTVAEPVYNAKGRCVCFVIADIDMKELIVDERSFLVEMITVFLSFFMIIGAVGIWLTQYHIIYPVSSITKFADSFSREDTTQEQLDEFVRQFRALDIRTGDEMEKLYSALCRMMLNQAEKTRSIRRLSEAGSKMQDGLIITMADLVESRDSDTGAHIQKTAAYVKIIVEGLQRKGYYAEKITPKFISDIVRSAPLHDVGKINIPDKVLNKPGKLTEEEYEIMKTHAVAGKRIMEHAIGTVEGDSYLKEARNMAAYHHERWDGKGYPEGLHGNVIPLSARIMAVADVFDALASPRVYKPAFPLEKALAIIEEGKGTQFDPKCVEVFMEALPEVKEILKKYDQNV